MQTAVGPAHELAPHPRLYIALPDRTRSDQAGSAESPANAVTRRLADLVAAEADDCLADPDFDDVPATHNGHLIRARRMQTRIVTLLAQWARTGERRYRDSVLAHVDAMGRWEYWSWITWRQGDARPEAIFDLSYGENSATLALAYDLLHADLDADERQRFVDLARDRALVPFLRVVERGEAWWLGKVDSNWNTVCAGGAGMLALALHEELAEAREVLPLVEESVKPFMESLEDTDGGWPEGIGYWAYGMSYAFMYLLSHERSTGRPHPLLRAEATRRTIDYPLDFWPYGNACSFGDSNHFALSPIHIHVARLLGCDSALRAVRPMIAAGAFTEAYESRPHAAEALLLDVGALADPVDHDPGVDHDAGVDHDRAAVRLYRGLGWVRMADRWPNPSLYLAIRGGASGVPHGHRDLLSFHAVVGRERLIENLTPSEYLDTTFGQRREELFEMGPQSKNAPLVDGVGVINDVRVDPMPIKIAGFPGIRLDATEAIGVARGEEPLVDRCVRLFVLFGSRAALVLDRIDLAHDGRVESRLHTRADVQVDGARALLTGHEQQLTVVHAAHVPAGSPTWRADAAPGFGLVAAPTTPTTPGDESTVLRWHGPKELGQSYLLATLLAPGAVAAAIELATSIDPDRGGQLDIDLRVGDWTQRLTLGAGLEPLR